MFFLLSLPFRALGLGVKVGAGSAKLTHRTVRTLGYRRLFFIGVGVGIGLLVAPVPGRELRAKARAMLDGVAGAPPADLADRVRDELASSPRTWHLPQPVVVVADGTVVLSGDVPHATAAADLERAARAVHGVVAVENQLLVAGTGVGA